MAPLDRHRVSGPPLRRGRRRADLLRGAAGREIAGDERSGAFYLALSAVLVAGVVLASEIAVRGAGGLVEGSGFDETAFGMTVVGLVMSLEEVLLVLRPVQKQRISIAVGNLLYFPFLAAATLLVVGFLWVGRVGRLAAASLAALYVEYWVMAYR